MAGEETPREAIAKAILNGLLEYGCSGPHEGSRRTADDILALLPATLSLATPQPQGPASDGGVKALREALKRIEETDVYHRGNEKVLGLCAIIARAALASRTPALGAAGVAGELPPLPQPGLTGSDHPGAFTALQMRFYAKAAIAISQRQGPAPDGGVKALREALTKAREQFQFYYRAHMAKEPPDTKKAETNAAFVRMCDAALAASAVVIEETKHD